ncbi:BQ5605_C006g04025 [Microbotryum silenes-dioicae]|uniref:BQ5605_C006g04025 protein n=1 Tax=Microbotryum silenes-dioicae TaxID=796604 RepID=A0A2X0M8Q4_9BASI|nr:BQ5605_C006g04025 [Microbotryum silenes-dioicae]
MQRRWGVHINSFSPTGRAASHRLLLALAVENEWETRQFDVLSAYLNGNLGGTEIYMRLPGGDIVRLQRALYGLVQAGREWYKVFTEWILSIGFTRTDSDHAIFVRKEGDRRSFLSIHVDDGLLTGDRDLDGVLCQLKARFEARSTDEASFFLGQSIRREGKTGAAIVNQGPFVDAILKEHHMANASPRPTPLAAPSTLRNRADSGFDPASIPYCAIVGKLLYLSGTTRPDIAFAVSKAARFCNDFTAEHWEALKHILRYLVGTRNFGIRYQKSFQPMSAILEGFVNADHGADPVTRRSVSGYVFMCVGGAISWIAKRQTLVTLSSTEAEYVAMSYATREGIWLCCLLADLGFEQTAPTRLRGDNQSAITLAKHPAFHARTKHIGIHFHFIRDHIAEGMIEMVWVPTGIMAADVLTKGLGTQKHYQISRKAAIGYLIRSARLFSEAWRCAPTVVFSPRLDYTLVSLLFNGTWGDVLIVCMDAGSSGGLSHMWAFSASSSRTDSKGRWKGPRLDANVEYSKYSKRRCMGVFVCCDQSCPGKRRPHTLLSTASRSKLFQEETPQLVTGRLKKAATRKHLAPNVERPSDELPPYPITSCNGPMRHILCSATIARGQQLRQLHKAAPQASAAELRMGQMTTFPQDPCHRPSASEICPVFDSTRSISRYAPRVGHSKRNGALPDTLMSAIEAVANAGCLTYIKIPGQRQGQPPAEQIHDPDPRKQPRNDGSRSKSKITSNSLTDSETTHLTSGVSPMGRELKKLGARDLYF